MLNGKFYMGLPPKMINRSNSTANNRQESHFYWPDDTDTETAVETRVRRRASLSLTPANKPVVQQRQTHINETLEEVDTKKMLHNQFSKSSIQFFDNIYEEEEPKPFSRRAAKKPITCKPTATNMKLPESDADTAALKNKHMFESKLEFNDFIGEDLNNMRKNKIDMNDKFEMERNTKNSPKLQNKKNVQNLIENNRWRSESANSDDEQKVLQHQSRAKASEARNRNNNKYRRDQTPKRVLRPAIRNGVDYSDYPECREEELYNETADRVDEAFTHMQINGRRPILKKRVSYSEEEEEIPVRHYSNRRHKQDNDDDDYDLYNRKERNQYKLRPSSHDNRYTNKHRQRFDDASSDLDQDQQNSSIKNNNELNNNSNNNNHNENKNNNNSVLNMAQKHLRSSLCFHDGEIVGSDNEVTSSTSNLTSPRRNARNMATKRVSVGLPD